MVPEFLYKYQSRLAARAVLTNRTLRWSTPATLNDPFDIQFDLSANVDEDVVVRQSLDKLWASYSGTTLGPVGNVMGQMIAFLRERAPGIDRSTFDHEFEPAVREGIRRGSAAVPRALEESRALMATSKILCLTERGDDLLMWSHYGDSHKGVALHFRTDAGTPYHLAKPIQYVEQPPRFHDEDTLSDIMAGLASTDIESTMDMLVYTKSAAWGYEREWRVFAGDGRLKDAPYEDIPFAADELVGVTLGAKMSDEERAEFTKLALLLNPNTQIFEARLKGAFSLEVLLRSDL